MSIKKNQATSTGVRYSDVQKKEIVEFVLSYNKSNGRGGQSAAAKKFLVSPLTIAGWLQAAGSKTPVVKKAAQAANKTTKVTAKTASSGKGTRGVRYSDELKQEVVNFARTYNEAHGRGGQNQAAKKFKLSVITVAAWLKAAGVKKPSNKKITNKIASVTQASKKGPKQGSSPSGDLAAFKVALIKLIESY